MNGTLVIFLLSRSLLLLLFVTDSATEASELESHCSTGAGTSFALASANQTKNSISQKQTLQTQSFHQNPEKIEHTKEQIKGVVTEREIGGS